jgi:hypothetical protein
MFEREDTTKRFFLPYGDTAIRGGFAWLRETALNQICADAAVWLPTLANADHLDEGVGRSPAEKLRRDRRVFMAPTTIQLFTMKTGPRRFKDGPVLALWLGDEDLDQIDELEAPAVCSVENESWKRALGTRRTPAQVRAPGLRPPSRTRSPRSRCAISRTAST